MQRCIYCLQEKEATAFLSKAHVVPQMMGDFNPEIYFDNELICLNCNNKELSKLEVIFSEDSKEGIEIAILGIVRKRSVRLRGERVKLSLSGDELGVFQNLFPTINFTTGKVVPRPCFVLRNRRGALQVLFMDAFECLKVGSDKYEEIGKWISFLPKDEMYVFGVNDFTVEKIVDLLKGIGVVYNEKSRQTGEVIPPDAKLTVSMEGRVDTDAQRFICMIAFSYFAYCAKTGYRDVLFTQNFDAIRNFVLSGSAPQDDWIIRRSEDPTLYSERGGKPRAPFYQISFLHTNGWIIAKVSLFGGFDYEVKVGRYPFVTSPALFGCGHNFDPINGRWQPLYGSSTPIIRGNTFFLFRREP